MPRRFEVSFGSERSAPELQRGLDLGGATLSGKIDRIDLDPYSARGIVQDYKSGRKAPLGDRDRAGAAAADPALHARPARPRRDRAARRRLPAARRRAQAARAAAREAREDGVPGLRAERLPRRGRVLGAGRAARATRARGSPSGSAPATCATTRRAATCPSWCDLWPMCRVRRDAVRRETARAEPGAGGGDRRRAGACSSRPAPARARRRCSSSASSRAVCERGLDVDSILVITYTERAAGELRSAHPRAAARARPARPRARARRRVDLDDPRLLPAAAEGASVRRRARPALPRARRQPGARAPRRGVRRRRSTQFCAGDEPERLAAARDLRRRRPAADADERLRDAALGRARARARARRAAGPRRSGSAELRDAAGACSPTTSATEPRSAAAAQALELARGGDRRPERLLDLSGLRARGERAAELRGGARRRSSRRRSTSSRARDRELLQELLERLRRGVRRRRRTASRRSTSRISSSRARDLLRDDDDDPRARAAALPLDHGRRVPGHEPAPVRARSTCCRAGRRTRASSSSATSSSRSTASATRTSQVFRERRAQAAQRAAADAELPLAARGARRRQPPLRRRVRRRVPAARARRASSPTRSSGTPVELLVTDKATLRGHRACTGAAAEARHDRAARRASSSTPATPTPGEIVLLFAAGTDARVVRGGAARASACRPTARPGAATSASSRSSTCSPTCGCCTTATTTRRSLTVLASPFVGVSNDALVLIRRGAPSGGRSSAALERALPADARRARRAARCAAFRQRYERLVEALGAALARAPLRADRRRARLRPRRARAVGRPPPLREPAQARAARALVRGAARRRTSRASSASSPSRRRSARASCEAVAEEEGADAVRLLTIHAAKGLEFKVVVVADAGREQAPPSPDEILCLADGRFGFRVADPATGKRAGAFDYEAVKETRRGRGGGRAPAPLLRRDDARDRPADRLRRDRRAERGGRADADRLGARRGSTPAPSSTPPGTAPVELERGGARLVLRLDRFVPGVEDEPAAEIAEAEAGRGGPAAALRPRRRGRRRARRAGAAASSRPCPRRRCTACAGCPTARSRCSSAAPTATSPSAWSGMRPTRPCAALGRRRGLAATEVGDAVHRLLELVDLTRSAPRPTLELVRAWYPARHRRGAGADRGVRRAYCDSDARAARRRAPGRAGRAAVRVRARRRAAARPARRAPPRRAAGARPRLQDERARRGDARGDRRERLPAAAARLRARLLPRRGGGGRGRLPLPRAARTPSSRRRSAASRRAELEAELSAAIARIARRRVPADAERVRLRRAARRSTSSAPGRGSGALMAAQLRRRGAPARSAPKRERIGPIIERLAAEHADARDRAPLPHATSSCSSR